MELLLIGAAVVRRWQRELTEGQGREVGASRRDTDREKESEVKDGKLK